eukprot:tig00000507_g1777.t1
MALIPRSAESPLGLSHASIICGCWQLAGGHGPIDPEKIIKDMMQLADLGYTTFDTADIYGPSESVIGEFLRRYRKERGAEAAGRVQVFTKLVPNIFREQPTAAVVERTLRRSLAALGLEALDMVQLHWWDYSVPGMVEVARMLEGYRARGVLKAVATTNMDTKHLREIVEAGVPVVANQVQYSILDRRPEGALIPYAREKAIRLLCYGPVAGGLLSERWIGLPAPDRRLLDTASLRMYFSILQSAGGWPWFQELLMAMKAVAERHGSSVPAVALRYVLDAGGSGEGVCYPIVGIRSSAHADANAAALRLQLTPDDWAALRKVLDKARGPPGDAYSLERS